MAFFDDVDAKISNLINTGAGKAKDMSESFRISGMIREEEKKQEDLYKQIGQYYYDNYCDSAEGQLRVWCAGIKASKVQMLQYQDQLNKLKGTITCPGCGAEVASGAAFCSGCGMKMQPQNRVAPAKMSRKCPTCGNTVDQDAMFCTNCGQRMPELIATEEANNDENLEKKQKVCPLCGAAVEEDQVFCTFCGQKIPEQEEVTDIDSSEDNQELCPTCGATVEKDQTFCTKCGTKIEKNQLDISENESFSEPLDSVFEEVDFSSLQKKETEPQEEPKKTEICPACGRELKPGQKFCTNCGTKIKA